MILEHPSVFTLGRSGGLENLKVSRPFLERLKIPIIKVERGGNITYHGPGRPTDLEEPVRIAGTAQKLNLDYVVVTSVTRDDLPDGRASVFVRSSYHAKKLYHNIFTTQS